MGNTEQQPCQVQVAALSPLGHLGEDLTGVHRCSVTPSYIQRRLEQRRAKPYIDRIMVWQTIASLNT